MAFSQAIVTHGFTNADGTPASGVIEFTLTKRMTNGSQSIVPASVTSSLDSNGNLSQLLYANNDAGTVPVDAQWRADFRVLGAQQEQFFITVPTGGGTVDLGTLLPQQPQGG